MNDVNCGKCKCWIRPFEPPKGCFNCCVGKILHYAKPHELVNNFNFEHSLAEKIFAISLDVEMKTLNDYKGHVSDEEWDFINDTFRNISFIGWIWITTTFKVQIEAEEILVG